MDRLLEPDLLRSFVAIVESGSVTEAAVLVGRTQSAVSMQMRRLEELLGRRLFTRSGRGITISADGELFAAHARRLLRAHREVLAAFDDSALGGRVSLGSPDDYASSFLPPVLARFAAAHPRAELEVVCEMSGRLVGALERGELDLALVTEGSGESGGTLLREEKLTWVGALGHPLPSGEPLPLAVFHPGCRFRRAALDALAEAGRASRIAFTSVSIAGVAAAVSTGLAIGVMLRSTVPPGLRVLGEPEGLPPLPSARVLVVRGPDRTTLADALEQYLLESCRSTPPARLAA